MAKRKKSTDVNVTAFQILEAITKKPTKKISRKMNSTRNPRSKKS